MTDDDRVLPAALAEVAGIGFDFDEGEGVDFEPYDAFLSAEETTDRLRAWTGDPELDGDAFRVFGQDGTGGYGAIWLAHPGRPLAEQPVVFLGSEGETGVVACDLGSYLWLLADGSGPREAVEHPGREARPNAESAAVAERLAPGARRPAAEVAAEAARRHPDFEDMVLELCR
ncbi:SMI1/KNR4 family protein [Kitasatospora sp. NPDC085895]|uniref:SMI1/KNR4 family protein n=1 Tax=Kitasatospora sp. NPDC085895 TaxID=3155057 RepID=UPI00344CFCB9